MKTTALKPLLITLMLSITAPAYSENQALIELLDVLRQNNTIDQQTYEQLKNLASETKPADHITEQAHKKVHKDLDAAKPTIGGRIQLDTAFYDQDRHKNGTEIRRARLFAQGKIGEAWKYKLQYDFTGDGKEGIRDAYLGYRLSDTANLQIGNIKQPYSLAEQTSSKHITFTERALPNALSLGRSLGIRLNHSGQNHHAAIGLFSNGINDDRDQVHSLTGRITATPINHSGYLWHIGGSASYQRHNTTDIRIRARPESHVTGIRLIDTRDPNSGDDIQSNGQTRFALETAYAYRGLQAQAEYLHTNIDTAGGSPSLDFNGYYITGSWLLTGENIKYQTSKGLFSSIKPKSAVGEGGIGAWQLAARFSNLDLNDAGINGGEQSNISLALNWYATAQIRFALNYVNVLDIAGGTNDDQDLNILQLRTQATF